MGAVVSHVLNDTDIRYIGHLVTYRYKSPHTSKAYCRTLSGIPEFGYFDSPSENDDLINNPLDQILTGHVQKFYVDKSNKNEQERSTSCSSTVSTAINTSEPSEPETLLLDKSPKSPGIPKSKIAEQIPELKKVQKVSRSGIPQRKTVSAVQSSPSTPIQKSPVNCVTSKSVSASGAKSRKKTPNSSKVHPSSTPPKINSRVNAEITSPSSNNSKVRNPNVLNEHTITKQAINGSASPLCSGSNSEIPLRRRSLLQITAKFKPINGQEFVKMQYKLNLLTKKETLSSDSGIESLMQFGLGMDENGNPDPKQFPQYLPKLMNRFEGTVLLDELLISMDRVQSQRFKVISFDVYADPPVLMINPKNMNDIEVIRTATKFEVRVESESGPEDEKWIRIEGERASQLETVSPDKSGTGKLHILLA